jgi:hypothetical protein
MGLSIYWLRRQIAGCLVPLLALPIAEVAAAAPLPGCNLQESQSAPATQDHLPPSGAQTQGPQSGTAQGGTDQLPNGLTKPVGTAAAPIATVTGVAAARPVGAAIAPAKQRRARAILIRVSIVVGAAVAVGTVVALSRASPSRPN